MTMEEMRRRQWTSDKQTDNDKIFMRNNENYVEIWMTENGNKRRSLWVEKDRLCVLGMKTFPEVIDVTQMSESTSQILEQLLTGSRHYLAQISMNQAAELIHVATELKFVNLLKIIEKNLIGQTCQSMEQAVDSLNISLRFGMKDAVEKLIDEIVFGFLDDENLLVYNKNGKAVEMILNRKFELEAQEPQDSQAPREPQALDDLFSPLINPTDEEVARREEFLLGEIHRSQETMHQLQLAQIQQDQQKMHKVIYNAAKQRMRTILNRPINSFKNGIAWVSAQNERRRRRQQPAAQRNQFQQFPDFQNF